KYSVSATLVTVMSDSIPPFSSNISEYVTDHGVLETLLVVTLSNNAEASLPTTRNRMSEEMSYIATHSREAQASRSRRSENSVTSQPGILGKCKYCSSNTRRLSSSHSGRSQPLASTKWAPANFC